MQCAIRDDNDAPNSCKRVMFCIHCCLIFSEWTLLPKQLAHALRQDALGKSATRLTAPFGIVHGAIDPSDILADITSCHLARKPSRGFNICLEVILQAIVANLTRSIQQNE